jgi:hypothetical protein
MRQRGMAKQRHGVTRRDEGQGVRGPTVDTELVIFPALLPPRNLVRAARYGRRAKEQGPGWVGVSVGGKEGGGGRARPAS